MLLYSAPVSLFARKVEIALYEKGLAFERVMVPFTQAGGYNPKHPAVRAANPKAQVPVLVDGDLTLYDSTVILEYLEDAHPQPALYPEGAAARARCRQLEMFADEILLPPVRTLMFRTEPPGPDAARRQAQEETAVASYPAIRGHYDTIDTALGGKDFLCGALAAADIAMFITVHYGVRLGGPNLFGHPGLAAWYARLRDRPAFARVVAEIAAADQELSYPVTR